MASSAASHADPALKEDLNQIAVAPLGVPGRDPEISMDADFYLHLGRQLRHRRRTLGLTQAALAHRVGVRFQQIHKYESGETRISAGMLWLLARALEADIQYFFAGFQDGGGGGPAQAGLIRLRED